MEIGDCEQWRLVINWPPLNISVGPAAVQPPVIQEHTTTVSDMDDNEGNSDINEHASGDREEEDAVQTDANPSRIFVLLYAVDAKDLTAPSVTSPCSLKAL